MKLCILSCTKHYTYPKQVLIRPHAIYPKWVLVRVRIRWYMCLVQNFHCLPAQSLIGLYHNVESISHPHVGISSAERIQQQQQGQCSYVTRAVLAMAILKSLLDDCRQMICSAYGASNRNPVHVSLCPKSLPLQLVVEIHSIYDKML